MYMHPRKLLLAASIALALTATSGAIAQDMTSPEVIDARLGSRISTTYDLNPHLNAGGIEVAVQEGKATLTGTVGGGHRESAGRADRAERQRHR